MGRANVKGDSPTGLTRNVLSYNQQKALDAWMVEKYAVIGKDDIDSAEIASADLNFPVKQTNIRTMREMLGIESNRPRVLPKPTDPQVMTRLDQLEANAGHSAKRIDFLETQVNHLETGVNNLQIAVDAFKLAMKHHK